MGDFQGRLNANEIFAPLYNMIISQYVFADNIYDTKASLVDMSRVDGGLYGDTKLYYSSDVLKSYKWGNDAEAANLLKVYRPVAPKCQAITLNNFRQIPLTVDYYLSKRAWGSENAFNTFQDVMLGWIGTTKRVFDSTTMNAFIGTNETNIGRQNITITLPKDTNKETQARLAAQTVARETADLLVDLEDVSRDFNDYQYLRSVANDRLIVVWNAKALNSITKMDLPTIFHKEGLIDKMGEYTLPARYFGKIKDTAGDAPASNKKIRSLVEKDYNTAEMGTTGYDPKLHIFAGDLIPSTKHYEAKEAYEQDDTILFKICAQDSVPYMSAFETGTSFFNSKSLTETHYLTWGYNTLEHLKQHPFITVRGVQEA